MSSRLEIALADIHPSVSSVCVTPFAGPVLPDVKKIAAGAAGSGGSSSTAEPWAATRPSNVRPPASGAPYEMIPSGIRFTQDKAVWEMPRATADSIIDGKGDSERILNAWYKTLSARMGASFDPSNKWLRIATEALLGKREYQSAVGAGRRLVAAYPADLAGYTLLANAYIGSDDRESAKRTLADGLRMLDRLELFDTTEREGRWQLMKSELDRISRLP